MSELIKRLIEIDLPIRRLSQHARKEKESRKGHVPRLHIYPAARPASACRAVTCAALWPDPVGVAQAVAEGNADISGGQYFLDVARDQMWGWAEKHLDKSTPESYPRFCSIHNGGSDLQDVGVLREILLDFIADFSVYENGADAEFLKVADALSTAAAAANGSVNTRPLVFDPFSGGGAIPIEALRCGCDVIASDLSPVALTLEQVLLKTIPKYGTKVLQHLEKWAEQASVEARESLGMFYPRRDPNVTPIAYIWARTVVSEAPGAGKLPVEIPLLGTMWLARKKNRKRALRWVRDEEGNIELHRCSRHLQDGSEVDVLQPQLEVFSPRSPLEVESGTVARKAATCPVTGYTMSAHRVAAQLKPRHGGAWDARLVCVACDGINGKRDFRLPEDEDIRGERKALAAVLECIKDDPTWIPSVPIPQTMTGVIGVAIYGHDTWGSLFAPRQLLALNLYAESAKCFVAGLTEEDDDYRDGLLCMLGLLVGRLADLNSSCCAWQLNTPNADHTFKRWALPFVTDFAEVNPLADAGGSLKSALNRVRLYIKSMHAEYGGTAEVIQSTAEDVPLPDGSADLFFTDPPYYNAIPYADLLDFFYVWQRKVLDERYTDRFSDSLGPKEDEACELSGWDKERYAHKDKSFFEEKMHSAMARAEAVIQENGVGVVVFAHKSTSGWEAMLRGILDAGWTITASWPIDTEMGSRSRAKGSAVLGSSIHIVMRPRAVFAVSPEEAVGSWRDVLAEMPQRVGAWLPRLAGEGVVGADAIFACLGPALEVFSQYSSVEKTSGERVALREYLEQVWAEVAKQALNMIFDGADTAGLEEDSRLTAMWFWTLRTDAEADEEAGEKVERIAGYGLEYDAARKIAQGLGCHLESLAHLVEIKGEKATLLSAASRARYLFGKEDMNVPKKRGKKKAEQADLFAELGLLTDEDLDREQAEFERPVVGNTVLDQLHQSMILFGAGRGVALKRFLVDDGVGANPHLWSLAQSLSALYPPQSEEKRWVDGVLARKKGLGF